MTPARRILVLLTLSLLPSLVALPARAAIYVYSAVLDPRQEVSLAAPSTGQGGGRFIIDTDANTVTYRITYAGLTGPASLGHIHGSAAPGVNAGVVHGFASPANPISGVWTYTEPQEAMILNGLCYANVHTAANPGGEIRGQIVPFNALMDASQETPVNASTGSGWCTATVDTVANTLSYHITYAGLTGAPINAHFHGNSLPGTPAGVKVAIPAFGVSPIVGTVTYLEADQDALLSGRWYVNLHTAANPGGEIRGQLVPTVVPMDALQEVGPTAATGSSAFALVSIDRAAGVLGYDVRVKALSAAETAAHIHGFAGPTANAGVLNPLVLGAQKLGTWAYGVANENNVRAGLTYFNVHTTAFPGGEIRGQLVGLPGVLGVTPGGPRLTGGLSAAPNPFGGRTVLSFQLAHTGRVSLAIVDVNGRLVRSVPATLYAPGPHSFDWDGMDDAGQAAAPGMYFAVVRTPEGERTTRIARLR